MCGSLNRSKTQGDQKIKLEIDQIKEKINGLTIKRAYKVEIVQIWIDLKVSNQNSVSQMEDLTEKSWRWSLDSDKSSMTEEYQINWNFLCSLANSPDFLSGILHLLRTEVVPLVWMVQIQNKWVNDKGWRPSLNVIDTWNVASIVNLCTCNHIKHANTSKLLEHNLLIYVSD